MCTILLQCLQEGTNGPRFFLNKNGKCSFGQRSTLRNRSKKCVNLTKSSNLNISWISLNSSKILTAIQSLKVSQRRKMSRLIYERHQRKSATKPKKFKDHLWKTSVHASNQKCAHGLHTIGGRVFIIFVLVNIRRKTPLKPPFWIIYKNKPELFTQICCDLLCCEICQIWTIIPKMHI